MVPLKFSLVLIIQKTVQDCKTHLGNDASSTSIDGVKQCFWIILKPHWV